MSTVQHPLSLDKQRHHISQRHSASKQHLVRSKALQRFQHRSFHKPWATWRQVVGWFRDLQGLWALTRQLRKTVLKGPSPRLCFGSCNSIRSLRRSSNILVISWYLRILRVFSHFSLHYSQRKHVHFNHMMLKWKGEKSVVYCDSCRYGGFRSCFMTTTAHLKQYFRIFQTCALQL